MRFALTVTIIAAGITGYFAFVGEPSLIPAKVHAVAFGANCMGAWWLIWSDGLL